MQYKVGITGGTFDHFHAGHRKLLDTAFANAAFIYIGVALPEMLQGKTAAEHIEAFELRYKSVENYINERKYAGRVDVFPIQDIFGPSLTEKDIEVIFATEENLKNVAVINEKRTAVHFPVLDISPIEDVLAEDGEPVASHRIRMGEIDRDGLVYQKQLNSKERYILPQDLRHVLRVPIGEVYENEIEAVQKYKNNLLITVGDIISLAFQKAGRQPDLAICDMKTQRHALTEEEIHLLTRLLGKSIKVQNAPGTLEREAMNTLSEVIKQISYRRVLKTIHVTGEEDLLAIPAILLAPLDAVVLYGQTNIGAVAVKVTEAKKAEMLDILQQFE